MMCEGEEEGHLLDLRPSLLALLCRPFFFQPSFPGASCRCFASMMSEDQEEGHLLGLPPSLLTLLYRSFLFFQPSFPGASCRCFDRMMSEDEEEGQAQERGGEEARGEEEWQAEEGISGRLGRAFYAGYNASDERDLLMLGLL
jgi:hypothetical protein